MASATVTYYHLPLSFYSQKGRFCLEEKGVPYKERFVYLHFGEPHEPWYMKINPEGKVPVLQHGDKYIPDSQKIAEYLDQNFDGPKLLPNDSWGKRFCELCREITVDIISYGTTQHPDLVEGSEMPKMMKWIAQKMATVDFKERYQKMAEQNPELREAYLKKIEELTKRQENTANKEIVVAAINKARSVLNIAEKQLVQHAEDGKAANWLCGSEFTLADIELAILLRRLEFLGLAKSLWLDGNHEKLENYYQRLHKRRTFQKVCLYPASNILIRYAGKALMIGARKVMRYAVVGAVIGGIGYYLYTSVYK